MSPTVVVDASLAVKWVLQEPYTSEAMDLLATWQQQQVDMAAPSLLAYEVTNVLHKRVGRGQMTLDEAQQALAAVLSAGIALSWQAGIQSRALELAHQMGRPATYDAHYLAVAELQQCEFWTADERLWNAVKLRLPWVRWIGTFQP